LAPGCIVVNSLKDAIKSKEWRSIYYWGGEIYKQSLEFADKIEITKVLTSPDADTFFQLLLKVGN
jgi:dihydrofolate reductase